ncbi:MAG: hypothetical protein KF826_02785 [Xanthobacteraceae bacterium]|nr:hypothetical protein [Xanthobacteraceae bacterium]
MKYGDIRDAYEAFKRGENVTRFLREQFGLNENSSQIIEIAYDLQAGSYIEWIEKEKEYWNGYTSEVAKVLNNYIADGDHILEAGTGELTTLLGVLPKLHDANLHHFATDISWSRVSVGWNSLHSKLGSMLASTVTPFVGDFFQLPLIDKSMDIVWTSHALEPNGGREHAAIAELFRVARKYLIMFEPSYEDNAREGQVRMDSLGYIKGLKDVISSLGGHLEGNWRAKNLDNPLNPTHVFVVRPPETSSARPDIPWACPATKTPMKQEDHFFWSEQSLLAYPILRGIPILRTESAILASGLLQEKL